MPPTEYQREQDERLEVMRQDADLRRQGTTMHQHAQAQADELSGGRFGAMGRPNVIGSTALPKYPAASAAHQTALPPEPPLGYSVDAMPLETSASPSVEATGAPAGAATPSDPLADGELGDAGASLSQEGRDND
jgi:hypothetical protein